VTPLQELVTSRLADLDLSYRAAAARSNGLISHGTVNYIAQGVTRPESLQPRTIRGLALALDLPVSEVERAVHESGGKLTVEFRLPKKADKLSPAQRRAVLAFVNALLEDK
jgi:hypothetical protein